MSRHPLTCGRCEARWAPADFADGAARACPACGVATEVRLFPALWRAGESVGAATGVLTDESSCFFHATRRAVVPCAGCGRFLCELCDVDFNGRHLCPSCVAAARRTDADAALATRRVRYDKMCLNIVLLSLIPFFWFFSPFVAPAALFLVIRNWHKPLSVLPVGRVRLAIAGVLSALVVLAWIGVFFFWLSKIL